MKKFQHFVKWLENEDGATAIEYSFIAAAMGLVLVPAMSSLASSVELRFGLISDLFDF